MIHLLASVPGTCIACAAELDGGPHTSGPNAWNCFPARCVPESIALADGTLAPAPVDPTHPHAIPLEPAA